MYCALPRGAARCAPRAITADDDQPAAQPALVQAGPAPGEVTIVSAREGVQAIRSLDGGATFAASVIGSGRYFTGAFGPGGQVALAADHGDFVEYYHRNLAGPPASAGEGSLNPGFAVETALGFAGARPVLVSGTRTSRTAVSSWSGQGDVHDRATWIGPIRFTRSDNYAMASGRRGLFIAHEVAAGRDARMQVRKFGTRTFGRARTIPGSTTDYIGDVGLAQDASGRLVAAWFTSDRDRIEVSASRDGRRWSRTRVLATRVEIPGTVRVALGPDGRGVVVWDENTGTTVRAARVSARALLRRR
jgi:hypothetical protein